MKARTALVTIACALVALCAGLWLGGHPEKLPGSVRDAFVDDSERAVRAELIDMVEKNFYKPVDESKLQDASLRAIVDSLKDRYSHYLSPKEAKAFQESVAGRFDGVGMSVEQDKRGLRVLNVFEGSPGARVGDREGRPDRRGQRRVDRRREQRARDRPHQGTGRHVRAAGGAHAQDRRHPHPQGHPPPDRGPGREGPDRRARRHEGRRSQPDELLRGRPRRCSSARSSRC